MKKLIVAAVVAGSLFTATVAGARQTQVKSGKESPRKETKTDKPASSGTKEKVMKVEKGPAIKAKQDQQVNAPMKAKEVKK